MKNYYELTNDKVLNEDELFSLKGGAAYSYGCQTNVCTKNRAGAKPACTDAYCRNGMGPVKSDNCVLFKTF